MTNSVTFPVALGGDGKTYTDDADPDTGLDGLGYTTRLVPLFKNGLAMAGYTAQYAEKIDAAAANADRAENARGYVEAVAEAYRVNITEQLRRKSSLYLNFERGIYEADNGSRLVTNDSGDLGTFTRTTEKRAAGPNGDTRIIQASELARYWEGGRCLGYLPESSRTNVALHSADFSEVVWTKTGVTIEGGQIDPYGTSTAQKLIESTSQGFHNVLQNVNITEGEYWGLSFSVKPIEKQRFQARVGGSPFNYAQLSFNAETEEIEFLSTGNQARIVKQPNGFIRVEIKLAAAIADGVGSFSLHLADSATGASSYQGDGFSSAIVTEPQFERVDEYGWPSSHIPTGDAPVSRSFDDFIINALPYMSGNQGTLYARFINKERNIFSSPVELYGSGSLYKSPRFSFSSLRAWVFSGMGNTEQLPSLPASSSEFYSTAISWGDGHVISAGAGISTAPLELLDPIGPELRVGRSFNTSTTIFNSGILEVMLLPFKVERSVLEALTAEGI